MTSGKEKPLPNYDVVPLRRDEVRVAVVQSRNRTVDPKDPDPGKKENIEHMCWLLDHAVGFGTRPELMKDLIVFHESPIQGWNSYFSRDEQYAIAIDADGWEVEMLAKKAMEYNCYVTFGSYTRHKEFPGHYVNTGFVIAPSGKTTLKNWKRRNKPGSGYSTSIHDVFDKFVQVHGEDQIFPVARTDIGNICFAPCIFEPEIVRAFAIKGAEIFIRYMTNGGPYRFDVPAQCMTNKIYGIFVNQSVYDADVRPEDTDAGGTAIFDDNGRIVAEASSHHETIVSANIPLAAFRRRHSIPEIRRELYDNIWAKYQSKYPPGSYLEHLPKDKLDAIAHFRKIARW